MDEPSYRFDPDSLHEVLDDPDMARTRARHLLVRVRDVGDATEELSIRGQVVGLLRMLGELDDALIQARRAVDRADAVGSEAQRHTARLRLAQVQQWRGDFDASNATLASLLTVAGRFGPAIEAFTHQHAGKNEYDQRRWTVAREHFARALAIRETCDLPDAASSRLALHAVSRREADR